VIAAGVSEGETRVVKPERRQERGMEIVHVDPVDDSVVAVVVGLSVSMTGPEAATG
jgi:hypothetical protein